MPKWTDGIHINKHGIYWINLTIKHQLIPDGMLEFEPLDESYYQNANELGCSEYAIYGKNLRWNPKLEVWVALDAFPCKTLCTNSACFPHHIWYRTRLAISRSFKGAMIKILAEP